MPAQGPITPLDCRWPRMADSSSTPRPRPGWLSLWLHDLSSGATRELPGTERRGDAVLVGGPGEGRILRRRQDSRARSCERHRVRPRRCAIRPRRGVESSTAISCLRRHRTVALMRRDASGSIAALTTLESGETAHTWPSFLPDGRHVIFLVSVIAVVAIGDLDRVARRSVVAQATVRRRCASDRADPGPDSDLKTSGPQDLTILLPERSRADGAADRCEHARAVRTRGRRGIAGGPRPARTDLRDGDGGCADLRRAGHDAARAALADARRHAGGIDERADRCVGPAHRAGRQTDRRDGDRSPTAHARCVHPHRHRNRRRRDCRCRPMSTRAACGRRTACASRGPDSGAR